MKRFITIISILLLILTLVTSCAPQQQEQLKVGVIIPLTGPAAIWGQNIKNGIELSNQDLKTKGIDIKIIYEDSQASPTIGLTAYNKLKSIDNVDVLIVAVSRVSVPIIPLADKDQIPMFMTLTASKGAADKSPYAFRFFATAEQFAYPHVDIMDSKTTAAILYVNDEYGVSVKNALEERAQEKEIEIVSTEAFTPSEADFKTHLTKIKEKNPDVLFFVGGVPTELLNSLKQTKELGLDAQFIEASVVFSSPLRHQAGPAIEGVQTGAFPFTLKRYGNDFRKTYKETYDAEPWYSAASGYQILQLIATVTEGKSLPGEEIVQKTIALQTFESLDGPVIIQTNGEINPAVIPTKIINGELVAIE